MRPIKMITRIGSDVFYIGLALGLGIAQGLQPFLKLVAADVVVLSVLFTIRAFYFKERPVPQKYKAWWQKLDASSFPSAHAARAALLACFFSVWFPKMVLVWALIAAAVCWSRILLKKHWWSDVIAGALLGLAVGLAFV